MCSTILMFFLSLPKMIVSSFFLIFLPITVTVNYSVFCCDIVKLLSLWRQSSIVLLQKHSKKMQQIYWDFFFPSFFSQFSLIPVLYIYIKIVRVLVSFTFNFLYSYSQFSLNSITNICTYNPVKVFSFSQRSDKNFFALDCGFKLFFSWKFYVNLQNYFRLKCKWNL